MADNTRKVRIEEQLKVKIGEAKNLASRNSGNGSTAGARDVYCTVALDQEEICRTPTIERTLSPFFGEEYQFEIPRKFRYLSIYVWDRDRHLKQDKPIGKIAIRREELHIYNHKDHWFSLRPVDADSEVQGMANILIGFDDGNAINSCNSGYLKRKSDFDERVHNSASNESTLKDRHYRLSVSNSTTSAMNDYKENENTSKENLRNTQRNGGNYFAVKARNFLNTTDLSIWNSAATSTTPTTASSNSFAIATRKCDPNSFEAINPFPSSSRSRVSIRVAECVDLAKKNGTCDPYVIFSALYSNKRKISKRTKVQKKTVNPQFDEVVYFDLNIDNNSDMPSSISSSLSMKHNLHHHLDNNSYTIHPIDGADLCEICISLWHDSPGMGDNVFLGEIKIPMRGKQQQTAIQPDAWYYLQPRTSQSRPARSCATPPGTRLSCDNSLGSLRLKLVYTADHVFPLATYDALMNLLLESCNSESISSNILSSSPLQTSTYPVNNSNTAGNCNEAATSSSSSSSKALETSFRLPITSSAVYILGEIISSKTDIAQPLVKLFTYKQQIASIIKQLADHEISNLKEPTTIFRGNTLVSKMMDEAMRLSGLHYLHNTLRPVLDIILQEKKPCEIDPTRVKDKSLIDTNLLNLQDYVERVFEAITKSAVKCPPVLCQIFHDLRECAAKHFPFNKEVRYSVVSGFIFLRFFAPAILGPKLFDLTTEQLDCQTSRTLTLISKTIQSLGNLVSSRSAQQPCKEEYTGQLYRKFCTEKHVEAVKHFLEVISTVGAKKTENTVLEPVLLKEGMMTKRAQGRKRFGRRNFKQRYFRLTTHSLSYSKSKGKRPICDIPLSEILAVEKLNERSFKMQNIFQIIRKDRPLYVQTTNCVEEKEWVDLLSKICQSNAERLQSFHPCAYINGIWSCCTQSDENASGCTKVSSKPFQMELAAALDPARDLQRVHTLVMSHMPHLEAYLEYCASANSRNENKDISTNNNAIKITGASNSSHPMVNMYFEHNLSSSASCQEVVRQLIQVAYNLEHVHRTYKQILAREIKYGSRQAPIGDDNYLHMIRSGVINGAGMSQQYQASTTIGCTIGLNCDISPMCYPRHEVLRIVNNDNSKVTHC